MITEQTILILILSILGVVAVSVVIFFLLVKFKIAAKRRKIESYGRESEQRIDTMLREKFGDEAVFSGIYLPYLKSTNNKHAEIDHLVVTRSGIFVIEVKSHNGNIRCPADEKFWWQTYNDKKISFYNPLWQNKTHTKIVSELLRSEGHYNVPVNSAVVFTSRRVTFTKQHPNVIKADELLGYIVKNSKKNVLSPSQTRRVRDIIKHRAAKEKSVARRHKTSIRRYK